MILGAVLAGGRSSRFGSDKAAALWKGRPLIDHVVERLSSIADTLVICGREHAGQISIADRPAPDLGPLGGLNAALHHAAAHGFHLVLTAPCDTPILDAHLLTALTAGDGNVFLSAMPVIGCWRSRDAGRLDDHLRGNNDRSLRGWARLVGASPLDGPAPPNINAPGDLEGL